ncbi:UDP-N-acetylmuramoyl-L-alanyl-D-glutamate--2,6-diaminopimelate ligase [Paraglaciecola aestuariivivens]
MQVDMVSINKQFARAFDQSIKPLLAEFHIDAPDIMISDLVLDSRDVAIHKAFIAIPGHALDGRDFIPQAISLGAKVIIAQCDELAEHGHVEMREQSIIVWFFQLAENLSALAGHFFQFPANSMSVIAVTGTNGKTSTVQLCGQLGSLMGEHCATIGTLGAGMVDIERPALGSKNALNTTPDAISMQRLLAEFVGEGAYQVALEASSHALVQHRIKAVKTDIAVFTNLSRDHLDYHGTMSAYASAKRLLLSQPELAFAVVNANDIEHKAWLSHLPSGVELVLFGQELNQAELKQGQKYCSASQVSYSNSGMVMQIQSSWGEAEIKAPLLGEFNVSNLLAAIASQLCLGKSLAHIASITALLKPVAGRMEIFAKAKQPSIVVDYAHTPDGLEKALLAARQHCHGKLWCVFGCGGDRDKGKRPLMGEIAQSLADHIIVTDDNVRNEDPQQIVQDILAGCTQPELISIEHERKSAIKQAVSGAGPDDLILVAGKGHENYQIIGKQKVAYDERDFVATLLEGKTV